MREEKPIMVTGASGFVGSAVLRALRQTSDGKPAFVALGTRPADTPDGECWDAIDLLDPAAVERAMARHQPATLIHTAWARSRPGGLWDAPDNAEWRDAGLALLESFWRAGGEHAVVCGTCAEYAPSAGPCREDATPIAPGSLYGRAKAALHANARPRAHEQGKTLAWARLFYLFGPNEAATRLVPSVIDALLARQPARTGSGTTLRDFAFVDDIGEGLVTLATSGADGAYNVASGEAVMLRDLVTRIGAIMGHSDLVRIGALPDRPGEAPAILADVAKIARDTGWQPRTPLDDALRQTIAWRQDHGDG